MYIGNDLAKKENDTRAKLNVIIDHAMGLIDFHVCVCVCVALVSYELILYLYNTFVTQTQDHASVHTSSLSKS